MRINKFLAVCGMASRRNSDKIIAEGRVKLNGRPLTEPGTDINEKKDIVLVDGVRVQPISQHIYLMLNKPKGCLSTTSDDRERKTVLDLIEDKDSRIFPIGRLDYDTEGLLLLTTDGDFANLLTHPGGGVTKTYVANIEGKISEEELSKLRSGVVIDGERTRPCTAKLIRFDEKTSRVEIIISEGRNRQVRKMFESIGKNVLLLKRIAIGQLKLGGLSRGDSRPLTEKELGYFLVRPTQKISAGDRAPREEQNMPRAQYKSRRRDNKMTQEEDKSPSAPDTGADTADKSDSQTRQEKPFVPKKPPNSKKTYTPNAAFAAKQTGWAKGGVKRPTPARRPKNPGR